MGKDPNEERIKSKKRATHDLTLAQIEKLKDELHRHNKELERLTGNAPQKDDGFGDSDGQISSDDHNAIELRKKISKIKRLLGQNGAILRGEEGAPDTAINENEVVASKLWDEREGDEARERRRQQIEETEKIRLQERENINKKHEQRVQIQLANEAEVKKRDLEVEQNKIMQAQVEQALDRGKVFKDRLDKEGADEGDVNIVMDTLEEKMQKVEDWLEHDKTRQNDIMDLKLNQRKNRRKFLQDQLVDVNRKISEKEKEAVVEKDRINTKFSREFEGKVASIEEEQQAERENLNERQKLQKQERLSDYQDKLQNSKGGKNLQKVLHEYQKAQIDVDKDLEKIRRKDEDRLNRDFQTRKAKIRSAVEL